MDDKKLEQILLDNGLEGTAFFTGDNYASAIIGYTDDGRLVYDYDLMVDWLMETDNCDALTAIEFIDYNTIRSIPYMGNTSPIILHRLEMV